MLAIRGEARCALKQWAAGAADLAQSLQLARKVRVDSGADNPVLARLMGAQGLCELGAGRRGAARGRALLQRAGAAAGRSAEPLRSGGLPGRGRHGFVTAAAEHARF
ncbi:MAG: hypothetical protein ACK44A_12965 [Roseateles sp.]